MGMKATAVLDLAAPWRIALEGDRLTRDQLGRLTASYRVLHDVPTTSDDAIIDHIVVGPTGVFVVVTRWNVRRSDKLIGQMRRQAARVTTITGTATTPIVCRHGGLRGEAPDDVTIGGVRFCHGRVLASGLMRSPLVLSNPRIAEIAALLRLESSARGGA